MDAVARHVFCNRADVLFFRWYVSLNPSLKILPGMQVLLPLTCRADTLRGSAVLNSYGSRLKYFVGVEILNPLSDLGFTLDVLASLDVNRKKALGLRTVIRKVFRVDRL